MLGWLNSPPYAIQLPNADSKAKLLMWKIVEARTEPAKKRFTSSYRATPNRTEKLAHQDHIPIITRKKIGAPKTIAMNCLVASDCVPFSFILFSLWLIFKKQPTHLPAKRCHCFGGVWTSFAKAGKPQRMQWGACGHPKQGSPHSPSEALTIAPSANPLLSATGILTFQRPV